MSKRNEFLIAGVSEKRAKARRQSKAGTPMSVYLEPLSGFAKRFPGPRRPKSGLQSPPNSEANLGGFAWLASSDRILATHVGSLVRPPKLVEFLKLIEAGQPYDKAAYEACLKSSIEEVVRQQVEAGIDIVSDGEFSKGRNWAFYVHDRISGISTPGRRRPRR